MSSNGRLTTGELVIVQRVPTIRLERGTATAWALLKRDTKRSLNRSISIAKPGGGYRSWAVQEEMYQGSRGNVALARKWFLNPHSSVPLAAPGGSSHGFGTRVDIVGTLMDDHFLNLARKHGFTREFGAADPNHFRWVD